MISKYVKTHLLKRKISLNPRGVFYGGCTKNFVKYIQTNEDEQIEYTDVTRLYPQILKRGKFPIGKPEVYVGSMCDELTGGDNNNLA